MEIYKGITALGLGLYIKKYKAYVISDLQIGYEDDLIKKGVFLPKRQFNLINNSLEKIFKKIRPKIVVINGDIKHDFKRINRQEWKEVIQVIDFILKRCEKLILIRGNHDNFLEVLAKKRGLAVVDYYKLGDICITHGHNISPAYLSSKIIIIGHEHPAISLREGSKTEKFKCFLVGKYGKSDLIVVPSFNTLSEGTDVTKEKLLSPFLKHDLGNFNVFIVEDRVYKFGKLSKLI